LLMDQDELSNQFDLQLPGGSWLWSYGSWIYYNYLWLCSQYLSVREIPNNPERMDFI
jgi:hypothetical protein